MKKQPRCEKKFASGIFSDEAISKLERILQKELGQHFTAGSKIDVQVAGLRIVEFVALKELRKLKTI